jgi:hypothetical protein
MFLATAGGRDCQGSPLERLQKADSVSSVREMRFLMGHVVERRADFQSSKATINATPSFDFLRDIVSAIPDPTVAEPRAGPSTSTATRGPRKPSDPFGGDGGGPVTKKPRGRKPKKEKDMEGNGHDEAGMPYPGEAVDQAAQGSLPMLGTWRRDMEGGGGTGPGGRGMYDDYEDDDDDY